MPYIHKEDRERALTTPNTFGELNFALTSLATQFLLKHGLSYGSINGVLGALEGAKLEFYRRVAAPYEAKKAKENGDVYPKEILS